MHKIEGSSSIAGVEMNNGALRVQFNTGNIYEFEGATEEHMQAMLDADSAGAYFAREIRPNFPPVRMIDAEVEGIVDDHLDGGA